MAQSLSSGNENCERVWSEEYDRVPLKQRLKILLARQCLSGSGEIKTPGENGSLVSIPPIDIIVKKEDEHCDSQGFCMDPPPGFPAMGEYAGEVCQSVSFVGEENAERLLMEKLGETGLRQEIEANNSICSNQMIIPKLHDGDDTLLQDSVLPNYPVKVKALVTDNNLVNTLGNSVNTSFGEGLQAIKVKSEGPDDFLDDLDHIVLKERKRILLSRKSLGLTNHITEGKPLGLSTAVVINMIQHNPGIDKEESHSVGKEPSTEENENTPLSCKTSESGSSNGKTMASPSANPQYPPLICSSKNTFAEYESCGGKDFLSGNFKAIVSSALSTSANVKVEPLDYNELQNTGIVPVKSEVEITDELDHMLLRERMKLLASREVHDSDVYGKFEFSGKIVTSALDCKPVEAESAMPLRIKRTRKRKKTVTDSVETALEEDAPGLLQVLINKGVLVDEIKLYGEAESNEVLDDSLTEDSFADLEAVISKLFSQNPSLLKLAPVRCTKGEKASYCLACLISLVEQARYLLFRKWPVEWGWCRDLQSFIFVFERHNRIVLERPEYGYATYFFELVGSLPVDWQIKRLVTAMKLTSCSRVTLIENRALTVGEDMSEGEARVLMEYGWVPNSGFGTMLNYRDRVVHDRKNDSESSEWRSKIGKLLMDGYNGGRIVSTDIPEKVTEYDVTPSPQIKLEI